jgi:hypothetical protein
VARLIPSFTDDHSPPGERDVFTMLAAGPDDWVVLHSLDLAPWNRGLRTEIDFLAVVPDTGILCIEVKSHNAISFEGDRWIPVEIKRSPFKQAADAAHTFHRRLRDVAPEFRRIPVVHCVVFPNASFDVHTNLSVSASELIDGRRFRWYNDADEFCSDLRERMTRLIEADGNLRPIPARLLPAQIDRLIRFCLPIQRRRASAREEIQRREEEIERILRQQQKPVLQLVSMNRQVIVAGGAGTGKTLIATEVARRAADAGDRVAFVCFNQMVGDSIVRQLERSGTAPPNLIAGPAIRVLASMCGLTIPASPSTAYWDMELPAMILERLTDPDFSAEAMFDVLVIDEAQDVLARPHLWDCLQRFLAGGITGGAFCLLGDFEHQNLADADVLARSLKTLERAAKPVHWRLAENCRNYRIVGQMALRLSNIDSSVYDAYIRRGGSASNYDIFFYADDVQQADVLAKWLGDFRDQGYLPNEITVLSFRAPEHCAAAKLESRGVKVRPARAAGASTGYTSVHAFKGLENKIIVLTDVVIGEAEFQRYLFYVGMTRATETVRVLCDRRCEETLMSWVVGGTET